MIFYIFKPYNIPIYTNQNLFHTFLTSNHFPTKFLVKLNHLNFSNEFEINGKGNVQH
jgi:hypothetical protein